MSFSGMLSEDRVDLDVALQGGNPIRMQNV